MIKRQRIKSFKAVLFLALIVTGVGLTVILRDKAEPATPKPVPITLLSATSSSTLGAPHGTDKLIDGNPDTFWSSVEIRGASVSTAPETFSVFFNAATISRIELTPNAWGGQAFPDSFHLQYTEDGGTSWTDIPGLYYRNMAFWELDPAFIADFAPIYAEGIRIVATKLNRDDKGDFYLQMAEVAVYEAEYVTIAGTAVSSSHGDHPASLLTDGNMSIGNYWSTAASDSATTTEYAAVYFGLQPISQIDVYPNEPCACFPEDFKIQYTIDGGTTWTDVPGQTFTGYTEPNRKPIPLRFDPVIADGLRLYATKLTPDKHGNYYMQISELRLPKLPASAIVERVPSGAFASGTHSELTGTDKLWNDVAAVPEDYWSSPSSMEADVSDSPYYAGLSYRAHVPINRLTLYPRVQDGQDHAFPSQFQVEYSTDGGATWYVIQNSVKNKYDTGNTHIVRLDFGKINANAIRVKALKLAQDSAGGYSFQLSEMKAFGPADSGPFVLAAASGDSAQKTADLNNMWSIYGRGSQMEGAKFDKGGRLQWDFAESGGNMELVLQKNYWTTEYDAKRNQHEWEEIPSDAIAADSHWIWSNEAHPLHVDQEKHYDNNASYVLGLWEALKHIGDVSLLDRQLSSRAFGYSGSSNAYKYMPKPQTGLQVGIGASVGQVFRPEFSFDHIQVYLFIANSDPNQTSNAEISLYKVVDGGDDVLIRSVVRNLNHAVYPGWHWEEVALPSTQTDLSSDYHIVVRNVASGCANTPCRFGEDGKSLMMLSGVADNPPNAYGTLAGEISGAVDVDKMKMTVWERAQAAMKYQFDVMGGLQGGIGNIITIPDANNDGRPAADYIPINPHSPSNYYDLVRMGYQDVWTNISYYRSLLAMSHIYAMKGDAANSSLYATIADEARSKFNATFWSSSAKRYVTWIDADGIVRDYGFVPMNLMAIVYGLADPAQTKDILDWISGVRTVAGDTSSGSDIYHWVMAPRANTKDLKDANNLWLAGTDTAAGPGAAYWDWRPDGTGRGDFGNQEENGGTNPYISYYDIIARVQAGGTYGADDAWSRFDAILADYHSDGWDRARPLNPNRTNEEYKAFTLNLPEVGLVPVALLNAFLGYDGMQPDGKLVFKPSMPSSLGALTVRSIRYKDRTLNVTARADQSLKLEVMPGEGSAIATLALRIEGLMASASYSVSIVKPSGTTKSIVAADVQGALNWSPDVGTGPAVLIIRHNEL